MVVRRGKPVRGKKAPAKRAASKAATKTRKPPPSRAGRQKTEITDYASKAPTDYHKAFAKWIVQEVGYTPTNRKDFLMGVSIATAARPKFMESPFLAEWREKTGETKRGPKPKTASVEDDEDFEDAVEEEEEDFEEEEEEDFEEDDFEDEEEEEDSEEEDDFEDEEEEEEDFEEEEEEDPPAKPAPKARRGTPAKGARTRATSGARGSRGAPAKAPRKGGAGKTKAKTEDDEFIF